MIKKNKKWYILSVMFLLCLVLIPYTLSKYSTTIRTKITISARQPNYTVVFNSNVPTGSTSTGTMSNQLFVYGTTQDLNINTFSVDGYVFYEWNTTADGSGTAYSDEENVSNLSSIDGDIVNLYAQWDIVTYTTIQGNGEYLLGIMKNLAEGSTVSSPYTTYDSNAVYFKRATADQFNLIENTLTSDNKIPVGNNDPDLYMWFDTNTIYYYTEADYIKLTGSAAKMFARFDNLVDISGLEYFDTSGVTDMNRMFQDNSKITDLSPLASWDVSNVTDMTFMFGANPTREMSISDLNPLSDWDVSNVKSFYQTFKECTSITTLYGLRNWNVSSATNMEQMFNYNSITAEGAQYISNWNVNNVTSFKNMFNHSSVLTSSTMPIFTTRTGTWDNEGTYSPN